jgi:hypothetical protein
MKCVTKEEFICNKKLPIKESLMTFEEDGYFKNDEFYLDEFHNELIEKLETSFIKNTYRKIVKIINKLKLKIVYQITMTFLMFLTLINKDLLINELLQKYLTVKRGQRINNTSCNSKGKFSYEGVDYFALENKLIKIERNFSFGKLKTKILNKVKSIFRKTLNWIKNHVI